MRITGLKIKNIGIIEDVDLSFDHSLLLFFGEVRQGKSTILNCVRWCFGGPFPADILRHGQKEGLIEMDLDDGIIRREFYLAKNDETKARELMFMRNGRPVSNPVAEIKRLVNPFLADQDYLRKMGETERKQYFASMFAVDTTTLDKEYFEKDREASRLRVKIKEYGEIDLTPIPPSNSEELRAKLREVRREHSAAVQAIGQENTDATGRNGERKRWTEELVDLDIEIADLTDQLAKKNNRKSQVGNFLVEFPAMEIKPTPPDPDTSELDAQIEEAARNEERAKTLAENQKRADQKATEQASLSTIEGRLRAIKSEKVSKLKEVSDKCGIPGLEFDEHGVFSFEGTHAGMLSTSQIMRLSSQLSALYPNQELGIELIDRAESLGASIFGFIERAKAEAKTILATVVGEHPAKIPEEVGVFVVESGKVTEKSTPKPKKAKAAPATPPTAAPAEPKQPRQSKFI